MLKTVTAFLCLAEVFPCAAARCQSAFSLTADSSGNFVDALPEQKMFFRDYHELSICAGQSFGYPLVLSDLPGQRPSIIGARLTSHFIEFRHTTLNYNFRYETFGVVFE